ncbi:Flp pilus assembly protein CpaB [Pandoraea pulmonicola]|uniref:Flp pilus assembly protein CpaB n=1 Tax=Pandoraea pulmonicola TaxID=93221 RepID=A0AAJ4ZCD1_PANPU|nr:Flp pilus assembly protein CpaB [Pandoraea pulmonicola]AJC20721.1 Flp pilus assembly protein CpaB [Pandoraea pulmonicola]SUA90763.1 Flp pilus assembly protein CpaB [Pandoraea pulmonicola]
MKNPKAISMLLLALVAGLASVVFAAQWLSRQSSASVTTVAVAASDVNLGQPLTSEFVKMVNWPAESIPPGAFADPQLLQGRVARVGLLRGEPILESKLAPQGTKGGLSAVIGEGKRAITVRVNDVVGVAGFALPGNYVDVIVNTTDAEKKGAEQSISKIVLEKILVLAVAQQVSRDDTQPKVVNAVTLEVTPEQAEKLDLARSVGTLSLVLRNQIDGAQFATLGATKNTLLNVPASPAPAPVAPVVKSVVVRKPAPHVATRQGDCVGVLTGAHGGVECF